MSYYGDYTTIQEVRASYLNETNITQDGFILDLIHATSREIENICNRRFVPRYDALLYDVPMRINDYDFDSGLYDNRKVWPPTRRLTFNKDVLEVVSLINGDGTTIAGSAYVLYPANDTPKQYLEIKPSSGITFVPTAANDYAQALTANVITGYHEDYSNAWVDVGATLAAAITTTSQATVTVTTGTIFRGYLIKIDSEYIYVSAVTTGASDTITMVRGVNGSTAATHLNNASVLRWSLPEIEMIARVGTVAYFKLRDNPVGDVITVGQQTFATPKDVTKYMDQRLRELGVIRTGLG